MLITNKRDILNMQPDEIAICATAFLKEHTDSPDLTAKALSLLFKHHINLNPEQKTILMAQDKTFLSEVKETLEKGEVYTFNEELSNLSPADKEKIFSADNMKTFKANWKELSSSDCREAEVAKIRDSYYKHISKHGNFANITYYELILRNLQMPGVAFMASYLAKKNHVEDLFVCANKEALLNEINAAVSNPTDQRKVFIVGSGMGSDAPTHKIPICLEKKNGVIHVLMLDSMGESVYAASVRQDIKKLLDESVSESHFYSTTLKREHSGYGCAIFSLQDGIAFLQDKDFLQKISYEEVDHVRKITALPPRCMIGTQSLSQIAAYKTENPDSLTQVLPKEKTIEKTIKKHTLENPARENKEENHYITKKHFKYQHLIVSCLENLPTAQIQAMIDKSLIGA